MVLGGVDIESSKRNNLAAFEREHGLLRVHSAAVVCVSMLCGTQARAEENLNLVIGQQKVISAPGVTRIAIANPNVADVKVVSAGQVLVKNTSGW